MNVEFKYQAVFGVTLVFISSCLCDNLLLKVSESDRKTTTGISKTLPAESVLQCAVLFKAAENAYSFNYNEGEQKCEIGDNTASFNEQAEGWTLVAKSASSIVNTLSVPNGGRYGSWGDAQYCAIGTYAVGYDMKIEGPQGSSDDTALNGIEIICQALDGPNSGGTATSSVGPFGSWVGATTCDQRGGKQHFLTSFKLQVEPVSPGIDLTSANYVAFQCRDFTGSLQSYNLYKEPGHGHGGSYGSWSSECAWGSAICGIQTKVEEWQDHNDDTALNDVQFLCCT